MVSVDRLAAADLDPVTPDDVLSWVALPERGQADVETLAAAAERARRSHRILIGIGTPSADLEELLDALSFTFHDGTVDHLNTVQVSSIEDAAAEVDKAVGATPLASMTCTGLLRMTESLRVRDGLVAESLAYSTLQSGPEFTRWLKGDRRHGQSDSGESIRVRRDGDRLTVVLDRPTMHNAIDAAMRDQLVDALDLALIDDTIEDVVLCGRGKSFCSGGFLDEFGSTPDPATAHLIRTQHRPGEQLHRLAQRMGPRCVAHVHGAVIGGGLEIAAFAGSVVADPQSFFRLPEVSMGLIPGAGGTVSVSRRVGRWRAAWMMLTGNAIDAETALRWNLVDDVHTASPAI